MAGLSIQQLVPKYVGPGAGNSGYTCTPETVFFQEGSCVSHDAVGTGERKSVHSGFSREGKAVSGKVSGLLESPRRAVTTV